MPTRTPKELKADTQKATQILELFTDPSRGRDVQMLIPTSVLREAYGIVFIRLYRVGFMLSAKSGTGVIIARLPDGSWSAPSGVSMSSVGFGHQVGGEVIDSIIVMNYKAAVKAFYDGGGQLQLGMGASIAVGPLGRAADVSASASSGKYVAATYAYSSSRGLFIGVSFEGSKISERVNTNAAFYGRPISAREILTGQVPPPQEAGRLYDMLNYLGAGPRPGLPFASKKDKQPEQPHQSQQYQPQQYHSQQQQQQQRPTPPPVNYANRPPTTADGFEEPPPPYEYTPKSNLPNNTSSSSSSSQPAFMNNNASSSTTPLHNDSKPPITQNESSSHINNTYNNINNGNAPQQHPEFNRGTINAAAVHHTGQNNSYYEPSAPKEQRYSTDTKRPLPELPKDAMTVVVAKYDYHSDSPSDLSFSAGDHIIVTKRIDDRQSWWEGEIGTRRGFFPANYTDELTD